MSREIIFEVCAETIDACIAARAGGADRIELCSALSEGGLTPSHGVIRSAISLSELPVHVILRPRAGNYLYSEAEFAVMQADLLHAKTLGASGVVVGILDAGQRVDIGRTHALVELAAPLEVTFHRAFDSLADLMQGLEDVIATGCRRLLSSGGERTVVEGSEALGRLVAQADGRIEIAVGGGLRLEHAAEVARITGARHFHGSVRRPLPQHQDSPRNGSLPEELTRLDFTVDPRDVNAIIRTLREA